MSTFTQSYTAWNHARHDAATPAHARYTEGRKDDADLPSVCAELAPLIQNGWLAQDPALLAIVKTATPDELRTLAGTLPGVAAAMAILKEG